MESWQQQFFSFYFIGKLATAIIENMNGFNDRDTRQWDKGKLSILFEPSSVTNILNVHLPIHIHIQQDQIYWCLSHSGEFSVKSAYKAIRCSSHSRHTHMSSKDWKELWKLKINLLWKMCWNILPTCSVLNNRFALLWIALYVIMLLKHWSIFFCIVSGLPRFGLWLLGLSLSTI